MWTGLLETWLMQNMKNTGLRTYDNWFMRQRRQANGVSRLVQEKEGKEREEEEAWAERQ